MTDNEVLNHFYSKPEFKRRVDPWSNEKKQLFCRLARAIHSTGLDWYHIKGDQRDLRFGRRNPGDSSAYTVAGYVNVKNDRIRVTPNAKWVGEEIETIQKNSQTDLNDQLMEEVEEELRDWDGIPENLKEDRAGLWPDDYQDHALEADRENESRSAEDSPPHSLNTILYGPPGTGKTYATFRRCVEICDNAARPDEEAIGHRYRELVKDGRVEFVTFHQSYGYEEFVEGLRPQTGSTDSDNGSGAGFRLEPEDGVLKRIAERARKVRQPYVLVIDEINRGNISKVFGEAITLVEKDKRSGTRNEIRVTLPYSHKRFTLPDNLYILGTMNTADRSIALLDTALRRRFDFEELSPKPEFLENAAKKSGINLPAALEAMNDRLEWLLSRDHLIGHAWLLDARSGDDVDRIMRRKIIPMLAEYFHEDWNKVRTVLGGGDEFIERKRLGAPPELDFPDISENRYRWTVREEFLNGAYERLIAGRQTDTEDDGTDDDGV